MRKFYLFLTFFFTVVFVSSQSYHFCYENFVIKLTEGGACEMKRYGSDSQIKSIVPGSWTVSDAVYGNPGKLVRINFRGSDETFRYTLITDGNGVMILIDPMSRKLVRCE